MRSIDSLTLAVVMVCSLVGETLRSLSMMGNHGDFVMWVEDVQGMAIRSRFVR